MKTWRIVWTIAVVAGSGAATAQDLLPGTPPPGAPAAAALIGPGVQTPARLPADYASVAPVISPPAPIERVIESTWYTRIDYFHWNERVDGTDFVNEDGALITLGYVRRVGRERFRAELFGGNVNYSGAVQDEYGNTLEPLSSHTNYLGVRGEYDLLFEPDWAPQLSFFVGIGTRLWVRDLPDDVTDSGDLVGGYNETWWTIYPYIGVERRRVMHEGLELYGMGRIGFTAVTLQHVSLNDAILYPRMGLTGQLEGGLRGQTFFLSAFFEATTWGESPVVRDSLQPRSTMLTVGLRTGFAF